MNSYVFAMNNFNKEHQDHLYYNLDIVNNETIDSNKDNPVVSYTDTLSKALLDDVSSWYFSIIRFQLNGVGREIPIFIPEIERDQTDANKTIYKITLFYHFIQNGIHHKKSQTETVYFETQNKNTSPPTTVGKQMDLSTNYYYVSTYSHIAHLINKTLKRCHDNLIAKCKAEVPGLLPDEITHLDNLKAPILYYEESSQLFKLYLDKDIHGKKNNRFNNTIFDVKGRLFFNSNLFLLFSNFHHNYIGGDLRNTIEYNRGTITDIVENMSIPGCAYDILPIEDDLDIHSLTKGNKTYSILSQDYESVSSLWCPVSAIVFTTNIIPIESEITGTPLEFVDKQQVSDSRQDTSQKVISDMTVGISSADDYSGTITYVPSGEYRYINFTSANIPLKSIQISAFWKHRLTGDLVPIRMPNKSSIHLKLMFQRKQK
eukprot:jgi/Bigna1/144262/aug1.85_g18970